MSIITPKRRSEERFSRNAETDLVCRLLLEKKNSSLRHTSHARQCRHDDIRLSYPNATPPTQIYTLSLHDALPIYINNTIDHRPEGDEKWFLENEKTVTQFCRKLAAERPLKDIRDEYNYPKKKGIKDECSRLLEASTMK